MEQRGDKLVVHSLSGHERNHLFINNHGKAFEDNSALSGLDSPADSRGWALLDFDRDGWQDVALVNANLPLFNLYQNKMASLGLSGGIIAVQFVGGNNSSTPNSNYTARDGYGASVTLELDAFQQTREHRCGDGFAAQHSSTMMFGLGNKKSASKLTIKWPSGKSAVLENVPEGKLVICYENRADNRDGSAFAMADYRKGIPKPALALQPKLRSNFATADKPAGAGVKLRVYTSMATWCPSCLRHLPLQAALGKDLEGDVEFVGVAIDAEDDEKKLANYQAKNRPEYRLEPTMGKDLRAQFLDELTKLLGQAPPLPSTMVTDAQGTIIAVQTGLPSASQLRKWLEQRRAESVN